MPGPLIRAQHPLPIWGRSALVVGLFFMGCWGAAILYWRATERMPGVGELAFCLVGMPLLLSAGLWLSQTSIGANEADATADSTGETSASDSDDR